jgi:hypothetical protein
MPEIDVTVVKLPVDRSSWWSCDVVGKSPASPLVTNTSQGSDDDPACLQAKS